MKKYFLTVLLFLVSCHSRDFVTPENGKLKDSTKQQMLLEGQYAKLAKRSAPLKAGDALEDFNLPELVDEQGQFHFKNGPSFYNRLRAPFGLVIFESFNGLSEQGLAHFHEFSAKYKNHMDVYFVLTGFAAIRFGMEFKRRHPEWVVLADIDPALAPKADLSKFDAAKPPALLPVNQPRDVPVGTDMMMMLGIFNEPIIDGMRLLGDNSFLIKRNGNTGSVLKLYNIWGTPQKKIEEQIKQLKSN